MPETGSQLQEKLQGGSYALQFALNGASAATLRKATNNTRPGSGPDEELYSHLWPNHLLGREQIVRDLGSSGKVSVDLNRAYSDGPGYDVGLSVDSQGRLSTFVQDKSGRGVSEFNGTLRKLGHIPLRPTDINDFLLRMDRLRAKDSMVARVAGYTGTRNEVPFEIADGYGRLEDIFTPGLVRTGKRVATNQYTMQVGGLVALYTFIRTCGPGLASGWDHFVTDTGAGRFVLAAMKNYPEIANMFKVGGAGGIAGIGARTINAGRKGFKDEGLNKSILNGNRILTDLLVWATLGLTFDYGFKAANALGEVTNKALDRVFDGHFSNLFRYAVGVKVMGQDVAVTPAALVKSAYACALYGNVLFRLKQAVYEHYAIHKDLSPLEAGIVLPLERLRDSFDSVIHNDHPLTTLVEQIGELEMYRRKLYRNVREDPVKEGNKRKALRTLPIFWEGGHAFTMAAPEVLRALVAAGFAILLPGLLGVIEGAGGGGIEQKYEKIIRPQTLNELIRSTA
jgi:hypothetical protein